MSLTKRFPKKLKIYIRVDFLKQFNLLSLIEMKIRKQKNQYFSNYTFVFRLQKQLNYLKDL